MVSGKRFGFEEDPLPKISAPEVAFADESRGVRCYPVTNIRNYCYRVNRSKKMDHLIRNKKLFPIVKPSSLEEQSSLKWWQAETWSFFVSDVNDSTSFDCSIVERGTASTSKLGAGKKFRFLTFFHTKLSQYYLTILGSRYVTYRLKVMISSFWSISINILQSFLF